MVRRRLLLTLGIMLGVAGSVMTGVVAASACSPATGFVGCPTPTVDPMVDSDHVDIGADIGLIAPPLRTDSDDTTADVIFEKPVPSTSPPPPPANCSPSDVTLCAGDPTPDPETPAPAVTVTLRDIASFRPAKPENTMEPGGWAVEDLPANFVAGASVEVVSGTLLGQPADVRFTPVGYRWAHSDGAVVEGGDPGQTWEALGVHEFAETGTSHAYAESGEFTVTLEVVLAAEYRFAGSPWRSIAGTLAVQSDPQRVLVGEFDTVLTQGDCRTYPDSPGC